MNRKKRVLVVDDVALNLTNVEQILMDTYDVITVNSGDRALRYLDKEKPDLILLDIRMENKDGIQTLKELRTMKNGVDVPVIMVTAKSDSKSVMETARLGIYDYVLKPFVSKDLLNRVKAVLDKVETEPSGKKNHFEN